MSHIQVIDLNRSDTSIPWGFRLEGGIDVGFPIRIMKITQQSIADEVGLRAGDAVVYINRTHTNNLTHEQAKMEIIRSANELQFTISRGANQPSVKIWRPTVVSQAKIVPQNSNISHESPHLVTRTSLKASPNPTTNYNSFNVVPIPFDDRSAVITQDPMGRIKKISHTQFNSPMGLYSDSNISSTFQNTVKNASAAPVQTPMATQQAHAKTMYCGSCGEMIKGVFIRVHGEIPMHPVCLKCCKCGVGLKNIGYFYINKKLYCETHARQATRPTDSDMESVTVYK